MKLQGEYARASSLYDECLTMFGKAGDGAGVAWTLNYRVMWREKSGLRGCTLLLRTEPGGISSIRDSWGIASTLADLAGLSCDQGDDAEARRLYGESIKMFQELVTSAASPGPLNVWRERRSAIECRAIVAPGRSRRRLTPTTGGSAYAG